MLGVVNTIYNRNREEGGGWDGKCVGCSTEAK